MLFDDFDKKVLQLKGGVSQLGYYLVVLHRQPLMI